MNSPALPAKRGRESPLSIDATEKLTQLGAMVGTPGFMAPEQILGMQLDGRADLYALGCCAWWLLTGREIFPREGADARILHKHIHEPIPRLPAAMTGWCPPELEAVIAACLAKDIADRPRDARALTAMLRAIPIPAEHAWTPEHAAAWWQAYRPAAPPPSASPDEIQIIMPGRTDLRPVAATSEAAIAQTVAATTQDAIAQTVAATSEAAIAHTIAATSEAAIAQTVAAASEAAIAHTIAATDATAQEPLPRTGASGDALPRTSTSDDAIAKTIASPPPPTRG